MTGDSPLPRLPPTDYKDANELDPDQVKAGDEAYTVISATGYGTVQHPCRTVEVVVGGQKPFWSLRNTQ